VTARFEPKLNESSTMADTPITLALLSTPLFKAYPWSSQIVYASDRRAFVDKLVQNKPSLPEVGAFIQVSHCLLHCFSSEHLNR